MFGKFGKRPVSRTQTISVAGVRSPVDGHTSEAAMWRFETVRPAAAAPALQCRSNGSKYYAIHHVRMECKAKCQAPQERSPAAWARVAIYQVPGSDSKVIWLRPFFGVE